MQVRQSQKVNYISEIIIEEFVVFFFNFTLWIVFETNISIRKQSVIIILSRARKKITSYKLTADLQ